MDRFESRLTKHLDDISSKLQIYTNGLPFLKDKAKKETIEKVLIASENKNFYLAISHLQKFLADFPTEDKGRCAVLNIVAMFHYKNHERTESIKALNEMMLIAERIKDDEAFHSGKVNLGVNQIDNGEYQKALDNLKEALEFYSRKNNFKAKAEVLLRIGLVYTIIREDKKAFKYLEEAREIYIEHKNPFGTGKANMYLGINAKNVKAYDLAEKFHKNSLTFFRAINNLNLEANALMNLGNVYFETQQYKDALLSHEKALELFKQINDSKGEALVLYNIGNVLSLDKPKIALNYYQQALILNEKINNVLEIANCHNGIGLAYLDLREYKKAFEHLKIAQEKYSTLGIEEYVKIVKHNINLVVESLK